MSTRRTIFATVAVLVVGGATWTGYRLADRQARVAQILPATPNLQSAPAPLVDGVVAAEQAARSWRHAVSGLAELSQLYHANGFLPEALRCYAGLRTLEPHQPRWPHLEATILATYGRAEEALPLFRRATELAPDYLPARVRLGDVLVKANQPREASQVYAAALQRMPGNPYSLLGLARCAIATGDWQTARDRLNEAVAQNPDFIGGLSLLITVSEHLGDQTAAAALRERVGRREFTDVPDPWLDALADVCFDAYRLSVTAAIANSAGDRTRALELLDAAIALSPRTSSYRRQAAQIQLNSGNLVAARTHLEQAVGANPADSDAWLMLVNALRGLNQEAAAAQALTSGLSHCPQSPSLHLEYARWLKASGRNEEAIAEFRRGYELRPSEASPLVELAGVYFAVGRNPDAVAALELALQRQPDHPMALATLTFYAISLKDEPEALRRWSQVKRQPKTPPQVVDGLRQAYRQQFGQELP